MKKLSVIVPCLNESESIHLLKSKIESISDLYSFIFVDDGSSDQTFDLLKKNFSNFKSAIFVQNPKSLNLGGIYKKVLPSISTEYVCMIDADCSYDPQKLPQMFAKIEEGYDFVDGSANHPGANFASNTPLFRKVLSKGVVLMYNIIMLRNMHCYTSMFRIYKTQDLKELGLKNDGFMIMAEIKTKLLLKNKKCFEFPVDSNFRKFGVSKAKILKNIKDHLQYMLKLIGYRLGLS